MTKEEFEKRVNEVTHSDFQVINLIYLEHNGDKDQFCTQWKKLDGRLEDAIIKTVNTLVREASDREQQLNDIKSVALDSLETDPDSDLCYKVVDMKWIISRKLQKNIPLNDRDKNYIVNNI